jgi:hypothetical protein
MTQSPKEADMPVPRPFDTRIDAFGRFVHSDLSDDSSSASFDARRDQDAAQDVPPLPGMPAPVEFEPDLAVIGGVLLALFLLLAGLVWVAVSGLHMPHISMPDLHFGIMWLFWPLLGFLVLCEMTKDSK